MKILLYFQAAASIGLGHLTRCRVLAAELISRRPAELFICSAAPEIIDVTFADIPFTSITDIEAAELYFDLTIVDIPGLKQQEQHALGKNCRLLLGIDDSGRGPFDFDILVRPNLLSCLPPLMAKDTALVLEGAKYIILNQGFSQVSSDCFFQATAQKLLVCFGGSDPRHYSQRVVEVLMKFPTIHITLVVGAGFEQLERLKEQVSKLDNFTLLHNCANMAKIFAAHDTAFVSGGTLLYEATYMGLPTLVLPQNEEQQTEANTFAEKGAVYNIKKWGKIADRDIIEALRHIFYDAKLRKRLSEKAKRMVSSHGAAAIIDKVLSQLNSKEITDGNN